MSAAFSQASAAAPPARREQPDQVCELDIPGPLLEGCRQASLLLGGPRLRSLGVTSAIRGEGRTGVVLALARVLYEDYGRRVAVVDMDLENPSLHRRLSSARPYPGLAEMARGEAVLDEVLQPVGDGTQLVAAGAASESPARVLTEIGKRSLLARIAAEADVLLADLPPLLSTSAGRAAPAGFETLLLVIRAGVTPVARIREATADLPVAPRVLLNGSTSSLPRWLRALAAR